MTPKLFTGLAVAAAISAGLATILYGSDTNWSSGAIPGKQLLPNLERQANNIAFIKLIQGEKALTFRQDKNEWIAEEHDGYPVKPEHMRTLVLQLSQARLVDAKTDQPAKHVILELENPNSKEAKSRQIQLLDKNKRPLVDIIVGKKLLDAFGGGRSGMYVRKTDENQTWLASMDFNTDLDIKSWVDENIFSYKVSDIRGIEISHPGEEVLHIKPNDDKSGEFMFVGLPEGQTLKKDANASAIARAFERLSLEDVKKLQNPDKENIKATATLRSKGVKIVFNLYERDTNSWLSIKAVTDGESSEENKKFVSELNKKTEEWSFKIPKPKAETLFKRWSDLTKTG